MIRDILRSHYSPKFDDIEISYERIFGKKNEDYGDYDIVFYTESPEKEWGLWEPVALWGTIRKGPQPFPLAQQNQRNQKEANIVTSENAPPAII